MAGITQGAQSPIPTPAPLAHSRNRRYHGAFVLSGQPAVITSSRRHGEPLGVALEIGTGATTMRGHMTAVQARAMACALTAAADACGVQHG